MPLSAWLQIIPFADKYQVHWMIARDYGQARLTGNKIGLCS